MRKFSVLLLALLLPLLLVRATSQAGELDGRITGGQAKAWVDEARVLIKQGDAMYRSWRLDEIKEADLVAQLKKIVVLYEKGSDLLQKALDKQEDPGVVGLSRIVCRRLVRLRAQIFFKKPRPKTKPKPRPDPKPGEENKPDPRPHPKPRPRPKPRPEPEEEPPPPAPAFRANEPPAAPVDAELPRFQDLDYAEAIIKNDKSRIKAMLKDYYKARKLNKLHVRHRLCRGNGCEACGQTGRQINLYWFRKAFWNCYTPTLRASAGALNALKAFHVRSHKDLAALGPAVKLFKVKAIDYQGYWAKVTVEEKTTDGTATRTVSVIQAGSGWYFYCPATDKELVPLS